jgi:hypothetical protein
MAFTTPEIMLSSSTNPCEGSGKFWDTYTDSECEDLGEAEARSQGASQPVQHATVAISPG